MDILERGISLAADLGAGIVQLAGYFARDEPRDGRERARFVDGLERGVEWAAAAGVRLGLENVDGEDVTSLATTVELIHEVNSPLLSAYVDVGNLAGNGLNVCEQLSLAKGQILAVQLKDARLGEFRRVPFGEGSVPFDDVFVQLARMDFFGPFAIEMWNDQSADPGGTAAAARAWVQAGLKKAGVTAATSVGAEAT
jgi:L-ribulose-5-phosphate 3-epimerase/hexulose-6-phosphate isomerase